MNLVLGVAALEGLHGLVETALELPKASAGMLKPAAKSCPVVREQSAKPSRKLLSMDRRFRAGRPRSGRRFRAATSAGRAECRAIRGGEDPRHPRLTPASVTITKRPSARR